MVTPDMTGTAKTLPISGHSTRHKRKIVPVKKMHPPDVVDKGIGDAGQMVDDKTGGHFDSEVQQGEQTLEGDLGGQSGN